MQDDTQTSKRVFLYKQRKRSVLSSILWAGLVAKNWRFYRGRACTYVHWELSSQQLHLYTQFGVKCVSKFVRVVSKALAYISWDVKLHFIACECVMTSAKLGRPAYKFLVIKSSNTMNTAFHDVYVTIHNPYWYGNNTPMQVLSCLSSSLCFHTCAQ